MISWHAQVTVAVDPALITEDQSVHVSQACMLAALNGAARTLTLTFEVDAGSVGDAARIACEEANDALDAAGIAGTADEVECMTTARFLEHALTPDLVKFLGLAGTAEVADMLGISRPRLDRVRKTHPSFPLPLADLRSGPVWERGDIERFNQEWERKRTGRPRKEATAGSPPRPTQH